MNQGSELEHRFTLKEVAQNLRESEWGLRRKAKAGIISCTKPGKYYLFTKEDIQNYLEKKKGGKHGA